MLCLSVYFSNICGDVSWMFLLALSIYNCLIKKKKKFPYPFSHVPDSGRDRMVSEPRDMIPWVCLESRVAVGA